MHIPSHLLIQFFESSSLRLRKKKDWKAINGDRTLMILKSDLQMKMNVTKFEGAQIQATATAIKSLQGTEDHL